ncbi:MAG: hypothetical protein Q8K70_12645 [Bacteroidota bacterium]|nr:hypothetical protein [Bacteroidota bacterium]
MKKSIIFFVILLSIKPLIAKEINAHAGIVFLGFRGVNSNIGATNSGGSMDKFKMFRPTYFTYFAFGQTDAKSAYWNIRGINLLYYAFIAKDPKRWNDIKFPSQRLTHNYNRIGTDYSILTTDFFRYFGKKRIRFGLGGSFQWNAEGVSLNDNTFYSGDNSLDPFGKYGGPGLGSGVYKLRYRNYLGIGTGIKTASKDGRFQVALNATLGPYTGGGMSVLEFVSSYAFSEKIGFQMTLARRRKNFNEHENLQSVIVKTNDLNFGVWIKPWKD